MKLKYFLFIILQCWFLNIKSQTTYTWSCPTPGGCSMSDPSAWTPIGIPGPLDQVVFDGTSTENCTVDFDWMVESFSVMTGYSGNIDFTTFSTNFTVSNVFYMEEGNLDPPSGSGGGVFSILPTALSSSFIITNVASFMSSDYDLLIGCAPGGTMFIDNSLFPFSSIKLQESSSSPGTCTYDFFNSTFPTITNSLNILGSNQMIFKGYNKVGSFLRLANSNSGSSASSTGTFELSGTPPQFFIVGNTSNVNCKIPNLVFKATSPFRISNNVNLFNASVVTHTQGNLVLINHTVNVYGNCTFSTVNSAAFSHSLTNFRLKFQNVNVPSGSTLNLSGQTYLSISKNFSVSGSVNSSSQSVLGLNGTGNQDILGSSSFTIGSIHTTSATSARNINLNNNVTLLDSLKINGTNITFNTGGKLELQSNSSLKARISQIGDGTSSSVINGNIKVRTFAPGGTTGWTNLGISGVNGNNLSAWDGQIPMTCNGCSNGTTSAGGPFISVYSYNEAGSGGSEYVPMTASSPLTPGQGYWVYLGNGQTSTSDMSWTVTGTAVQGSVNVSLTKTAGSANPGFNLIANPYSCPIDFQKLMKIGTNSLNITNVSYVFNPDLGLTTSYNGVTDVSSHTNGANKIIPMGQGFHVEALSNTTFVIAEKAKSNANTSSNPLLKSYNSNSSSLIRLSLNSAMGSWDETVIYIHPNATVQEDLMDAKKIFPNSFNTSSVSPDPKKATISSKSLNKDFSINSLPVSINGYTIPVLVKSPVSGVYSISITEQNDIPAGTCLYIKDKHTNTFHNLLNGAYSFNFHDSTQTPRFELQICGGWLPTGVTESKPKDPASFVKILRSENGFHVSGTYLNGSQIRITNLLGQILYENNNVNAPDNTIDIPFRTDEKLIIFTLQTQNEKISRKFLN